MGYSCPVCETPQHDSEHLANHLAMTAMLHEADHEAWLDEHIDGWAELTPPALGKRVVDAAEQVDYDEAAVEQADIPDEFRDDEPDGDGDAGEHEHADEHDHAGGHQHDHGSVPDVGGVDESAIQGAEELDEETQEVLVEARKLTKQRRQQAAKAAEEADEDSEDGDDQNDDTTADAEE